MRGQASQEMVAKETMLVFAHDEAIAHVLPGAERASGKLGTSDNRTTVQRSSEDSEEERRSEALRKTGGKTKTDEKNVFDLRSNFSLAPGDKTDRRRGGGFSSSVRRES